ncbi:MAG: radical SAM protein, partial [Deltaproteobacteria bacterium]
VHYEKFCPDHGSFETRIAADYDWLKSLQSFAAQTVTPASRQTAIAKGCPLDCGECTGHRQKSACLLFEITHACDLHCPICLGNPDEHGHYLSITEMESMVKTVLAYAGPGQIVTLGGGEPTLHPEFFDFVSLLKQSGFEDIWVYTNGRRIARQPDFARRMAKENLYVVLQWDGFSDKTYTMLRGKALMDEKRQALEHLQMAGSKLGLCPTIVAGVNDQELGKLYEMFLTDSAVGTLDIATMAYVGNGTGFNHGREHRVTAQDVLICLEKQTGGAIGASDFSPVSFSHPECLQIAYLLPLPSGGFIPLKRFLDSQDYQTLILNKPLLVLNADLEALFRDVVNRLWASGKKDSDTMKGLAAIRHLIDMLFPVAGALSPKEFKARSQNLVKVVLVHSYMDGLNFDIGRTKMCISRTMLADGRLMPTCAYNVVHRYGERVTH